MHSSDEEQRPEEPLRPGSVPSECLELLEGIEPRQPNKLTADQFESMLGFNLQNKVRDYVTSTIEPYITQSNYLAKRLEEFDSQRKKQQRKIEELTFVLQKTMQRSSALEDIHQQLLSMQTAQKESERDILNENVMIKQEQRNTLERLVVVEEICQSSKRLQDLVQRDLKQMRNDITRFKDEIIYENEEYKGKLEPLFDDLKLADKKLKEFIN